MDSITEPRDSPNEAPNASPPGGCPSAFNKGLPYRTSIETFNDFTRERCAGFQRATLLLTASMGVYIRKQVSVHKPPSSLDEQCVAVVTAALQWGAAAAAAATQRSDRLVDDSARAVAAAKAEAQSTRHTSLQALQLYFASVAAQHNSDDHGGGGAGASVRICYVGSVPEWPFGTPRTVRL
jgi:hypothetical protein